MPFAQPLPESNDQADIYKGQAPGKGLKWGVLVAVLVGIILAVQWSSIQGGIRHLAGGPADNIPWRKSLQAALDESLKTGKPVLADFTASWCPPCRSMKQEVWPDGRVSKLARESFVPVLLDVDVLANAPWAQKYGVRSIPRVLVLDGKGAIIKDGSYMTSDEMLSFMQAALAY